MEGIEIKRITAAELPLDLVYEADESAESVSDYLSRGEIYAAFIDGKIVGEYILLHTRPFTAEIMNVAVTSGVRNRGIGRMLVGHAVSEAKRQGFRILEIRTGNAGIGQIALYQKCGFRICGIDHGYISTLYPEPIFENGIECRDMVIMQMYLI